MGKLHRCVVQSVAGLLPCKISWQKSLLVCKRTTLTVTSSVDNHQYRLLLANLLQLVQLWQLLAKLGVVSVA